MTKCEQMKELQNKRKKTGLCITCGKKREGESTVRCNKCLQRCRENRRRLDGNLGPVGITRLSNTQFRTACGGGYRVLRKSGSNGSA